MRPHVTAVPDAQRLPTLTDEIPRARLEVRPPLPLAEAEVAAPMP